MTRQQLQLKGCSSDACGAGEGFKYVGGGYGYFLSKYDHASHQWEQAIRWGFMFVEGEGGGLQLQAASKRV